MSVFRPPENVLVGPFICRGGSGWSGVIWAGLVLGLVCEAIAGITTLVTNYMIY